MNKKTGPIGTIFGIFLCGCYRMFTELSGRLDKMGRSCYNVAEKRPEFLKKGGKTDENATLASRVGGANLYKMLTLTKSIRGS